MSTRLEQAGQMLVEKEEYSVAASNWLMDEIDTHSQLAQDWLD